MANQLADMHDVGPQLTEAVAERISSCVRTTGPAAPDRVRPADARGVRRLRSAR